MPAKTLFLGTFFLIILFTSLIIFVDERNHSSTVITDCRDGDGNVIIGARCEKPVNSVAANFSAFLFLTSLGGLLMVVIGGDY